MRSRVYCAVGCFLLAVILLFICIPITITKTYPVTYAVTTTKDIKKGEKFVYENIKFIEVGNKNMPNILVTDINDVLGRFASVDIVKDDILLSSKISQVPFIDGKEAELLPKENETVIAMVKILEGSEITELSTGDIIKMNGYDDGLIDIPALNFVRVISVIETKEGISMITVSANEKQKEFLKKHSKDTFHISVISRNNEELANKLLQQQEEYFKE